MCRAARPHNVYVQMCISLTVGFEWDADKAGSNVRKHGVDFADAATARLLVVVWTWRETRIRLISARPPTKAEHRQCEERT